MEYKKITQNINFLYLFIMKLYFLYSIAILLVLWPYAIIANNLRDNLQDRTTQFENVLSTYSIYLQNK